MSRDKGKRVLSSSNLSTDSSQLDVNMGSTSTRQLRRRSSVLTLNSYQISPSETSSSSLNFPSQTSSSLSPTRLAPPTYDYFDLGDCVCACSFCGAQFWFAERLKRSPSIQPFTYNQCCKAGRVRLRLSPHPPAVVKELYQQSDFIDNIRAYNSMFSMTSFGATIDNSINVGSGPYVFKISGQVSHWIGSLCPPLNERPRFLQMYIYDTENEVSNRLRFFQGECRSVVKKDIVDLLISLLQSFNEVIKLFRTARDLCLQSDIPDFYIQLHHSQNQISYDSPVHGAIGAIVYEDAPPAEGFDIVIRLRDDSPQRINKLHPLYMALQYPLLLLYGERGWSPDLRLTSDGDGRDRKLTMNMFYSFMLHDRKGVYSLLLRGGRLFQQYLVDAYVCMEQSRLDYIRYNQNLFRTEYLQGIHDALLRGDTEGQSVGKRIILPSSFTGGPRYMYKHYQDALAICRVHGNPQYFITFTCNVKWPEITRFLNSLYPLKAQDRPYIIARVFQMKVEAMLDFLRSQRPFGEVAADLYTIEFQKRGLPHCHMLLWVTQSFQIRCSEQVDSYISAEIPDPTLEPVLHKIVTDSMIHGPCGLAKKNAPCMTNGLCSKNFPKSYESVTRFDKNGYVHYKRRSDGPTVSKNGIFLDNAYVVPFNKILCLRFRAHINVEYCGWNMVIKYLFKYISKGADRIRFTITNTPVVNEDVTTQPSAATDEIKNFVDGRFLCPHESAWRIFDFPIHHRNPPVQVLAVHLENMQNVYFRGSQQLRSVVQNSFSKKTTLTEWLLNNTYDKSGRHLRYIDYLSEYRWDASGRYWSRRLNNRTPTIGRLIYVHPSCGETFYLRMLLFHRSGCTSFSDIRTVDGATFSTFRAACERLGLVGDDDEWSTAFDEAANWATASELRSLFAHMLLYCEVTNPTRLWEEKWARMTDDVISRLGVFQNTSDAHVDDEYLKQYVLYEIELLLNSYATPSSLSAYGLPLPNSNLLGILKNRLLLEEKNYDKQELATTHQRQRRLLRGKQVTIYEAVIDSIHSGRQLLIFVYGHGGTGKTFLWTTIINALRSQGKVVLAVAASGIASLLLPSGRTAHSRFKLPIDMKENDVCNVKKNTHLAQLLIEASLIIWDEAPMNDRRCFEALDRTLKDILNNNDAPFGGKSVILGGDFRQTLPVKRRATKSQILASSLPRSYLWEHFTVHKLTENMRLHRYNQSASDIAKTSAFANWLLQIGDDTIGIPDEKSPHDTRILEIPPDFLIPVSTNALPDFIHSIYDADCLQNPTVKNLSDKAIVCPTNETADKINALILNMTAGDCATYISSDSIVPHAKTRGDLENLYPVEYLNQLNFSGLPPNKLILKLKTPIILLRNLNQSAGLCNGTRLIITQLLPRIIEAQVITGTAVGHRVYIPRIILTHTDPELSFVFKRKQFPIKLCYVMTINKSQGQSLNKIGVYLPQPVFGHGQLYVAFSRATSPDALKVLIEQNDGTASNSTKNIVYSEYLSEINLPQDLHLHVRRSSEMTSLRISSLVPEIATDMLEVRVIRKWTQFTRRELCFLFVDIHGDAIEAIADHRSKSYFDAFIKVDCCYSIKGFICAPARSQYRVVDHDACVMFGNSSSVVLIQNESIPRSYFRFASYEQLQQRMDANNKLLTDYIRRFIDASEVPNSSQNRLLRVTLQDQSGRTIELALWRELANAFDKNAATKGTEPVIVAATALRVSKYSGNLQFTNTDSTVTYVNPRIDLLPQLIESFKHVSTNILPAPPAQNEAAEKNITSLSNAVYQLIDLQSRDTFTCLATIIDIETKSWYYDSCTKCKSKARTNGKISICLEHGLIKAPAHRYRLATTLMDETCTTKAVIFNEITTSLTGISCEDLFSTQAAAQPNVLPTPICNILDKQYIYELEARTESNDRSVIMSNVFKPSETSSTQQMLPLTPTVKSSKRQLEIGQRDVQLPKRSKNH